MVMATAVNTPLVPLEEYLSTSYEPDCDYVDGVLEDRNVGQSKHSKAQTELIIWLGGKRNVHGQSVRTEQRIRVSPSRVRVPDVCLVDPTDKGEIIQSTPPLWIEVLSPDDRWQRLQKKLDDVERLGSVTIWVIDPYAREAWSSDAGRPLTPVRDGVLRCQALGLECPLNEILPED